MANLNPTFVGVLIFSAAVGYIVNGSVGVAYGVAIWSGLSIVASFILTRK